MRKNIEDIFELCLDDLKNGLSQKECLEKYREYAKELKPLLEVVIHLEVLPKPQPNKTLFYETLVKVGRYLPLSKPKFIWSKLNLDWFFNPGYVFAKTVAGILIFTLFSYVTLTASADTVPGNVLYPIKLFTEKVKLILTFSAEDKAELRLTFADKRTKELILHFKKDGILDKDLLKSMLEEAKLALDNISYIPEERKPIFYDKIKYFNLFQKETLENLRIETPEKDIQYINEAIEQCGDRVKGMQEMMGNKMYCPWDNNKQDKEKCIWK